MSFPKPLNRSPVRGNLQDLASPGVNPERERGREELRRQLQIIHAASKRSCVSTASQRWPSLGIRILSNSAPGKRKEEHKDDAPKTKKGQKRKRAINQHSMNKYLESEGDGETTHTHTFKQACEASNGLVNAQFCSSAGRLSATLRYLASNGLVNAQFCSLVWVC